MGASQELWDKFRAAQRAKNGGAASAYQHAIELVNKGNAKDAEWWEKMGDMEMGITEDYATR